MQPRTALIDLPTDVLSLMLGFCSGADVARAARVCRTLRAACEDETLWMRLCQAEWSRPVQSQPTWRATYIDMAKGRAWFTAYKLTEKWAAGAASNTVRCVDANNRLVVSASHDDSATVIDIDTGYEVFRRKNSFLWYCEISGDRFGVGGKGDVELYDLAGATTDPLVKLPTTGTSMGLDLRTPNVIGVASSSRSCSVWDERTCKVIATFPAANGEMNGVRVEGDLVYGASDDSNLYVFDTRKPDSVLKQASNHDGWCKYVFTFGNHAFTTGDDGKLVVWDRFDLTVVNTVEAELGWIFSCTVDSAKVLCACERSAVAVYSTQDLLSGADEPRENVLRVPTGGWTPHVRAHGNSLICAAGDHHAHRYDLDSS